MSPEPTGVHGLLKQRKLFTHKYDKEDVIKNAVDFQKSYESKQIGNKQIAVRIWQSNEI